MITRDEYLRGYDETYKDEFSEQLSDNADYLLKQINEVRAAYGKPMIVSSGWRPKSINKMIANAAHNSAHMTCEAIDIRDTNGQLRDWCLQNLELLKKLGLYLENFQYTKGWVHFSTRKPASGKRIFVPSKGLPPNPEWWPNPIYDSKFDSKPDKA